VTRRFVGGASDLNAPSLPAGLANKAYVDMSRVTTADPLAAWWQAYSRRDSRQVTVALVGDSIPYGQGLGVGTTPDLTNYFDYMGLKLQDFLNGVQSFARPNWVNTALGDKTQYANAAQIGGYNVRPAYCGAGGGFPDPWRVISGTTTLLTRGMGAKILQLNAGARIAHTADAATGFMWWTEDGASQLGQLGFSIYAGGYDPNRTAKWAENAAVPQNTGIAQYSVSLTGQQLPTRGRYTIEFSVITGTPVLEQLYVVDGDAGRGVKVFNMAYGATLSSNFAANTTEANTAASTLTKLDGYQGGRGVDLIVLYVGANDYANSVSIATFTANLNAIIAKYRAAQTRPMSFLICSHFDRWDVAPGLSPTWAEYKAVHRAVAAANTGCAYLDLQPLFPTSQAADTTDDWVDPTGVHLTNTGQSMVARAMADVLMRGLVMA
jgi:lysophospholipase L1-like esterase